jgi:hypothetical protein
MMAEAFAGFCHLVCTQAIFNMNSNIKFSTIWIYLQDKKASV